MIRGTTPTLEFKLPFDVKLIEKASIALSQNRTVAIEKTLDDCTAEGQLLMIKLTQKETLKLRAGTKTEIQVRVKTYDGDALASNIIEVTTDRILREGEI